MKRQTDFIARYDGDGEKFVVLTTDMTRHQAIEYGHTLCANVRNLNIPHKGSPNEYLTVSCGIAHVNPISSSSPSLLLLQADKALFISKNNGRNRATINEDSSDESSQHFLEVKVR